MIRLPHKNLPDTTSTGLKTYQDEVNAQPNYEAQVDYAKASFAAKNRKSNPVFREVRKQLVEMCSGTRRCGYCEDSWADEVEHIAPKDLYPQSTFVWENLMYACGPCNGPKNNRYAVFVGEETKLTNITRKRNAPVTEPPLGKPGLINPRTEDPMALIWLDFDTFRMVPDPLLEVGSRSYQRAQYTVDELLRLNAREDLVQARKNQFSSFQANLNHYIELRDNGAQEEELAEKVNVIRRQPHQTVWEEMKRQRDDFPELRDLFSKAPEALEW